MKSNFDRTLIGKPPAGYIPGISRGCHGFVTRSDIGPMMADITSLAREQAIAVSKEREKHRFDSDEEDNTLNDVHFDSWGGFRNVKLFNNLVEDEEDKEAEEAYAVVDKYLEGRTARKVAAIEAEEQRLKKKNPQARDALKDAIAEVKTLSAQDWARIPESNDVSKKRYKEDKSTPVPDAIVNERLSDGRLGQALDRVVRATPIGTPGTQGADSVLPAGELSALADARRVLLEKSLSKTGMNSTLDKAGYKTALDASISGRVGATGDFQDLKKARALYRSNVESNPSDPKAWIGVIRVEELDGKLEEARNIAAQAIIRCPFEDSVWLETIRIEPSIQGKRALAVKAVKSCPQSVKLWMAGAEIETEKEARILIIEKALKLIPQSEKLWKYLIEQATSDSQAKEWLSTAVQCVPVRLSSDPRITLTSTWL